MESERKVFTMQKICCNLLFLFFYCFANIIFLGVMMLFLVVWLLFFRNYLCVGGAIFV